MTLSTRHLVLVLTLSFLTGCSSLFPKHIPNPSLILPPDPPQIDSSLKEVPPKLVDPTDRPDALTATAVETLAGADLSTKEGQEVATFTVRLLAKEHTDLVVLYRVLRKQLDNLVKATERQEQWYKDLVVILEKYEKEVNAIK